MAARLAVPVEAKGAVEANAPLCPKEVSSQTFYPTFIQYRTFVPFLISPNPRLLLARLGQFYGTVRAMGQQFSKLVSRFHSVRSPRFVHYSILFRFSRKQSPA